MMTTTTNEPQNECTSETAATGRIQSQDNTTKTNSHDVESGPVDDDDHDHISTVSSDDLASVHSQQRRQSMTRISTNVSLGPDIPVEHYTSFVEVPDSVYDRIPNRRKIVIVALLSYCAFLAPISSTTVLSATPEVAAEYHTTGTIVDISNALYLLFMGISPIVWGPFSEVWGRKIVSSSSGSSMLHQRDAC